MYKIARLQIYLILILALFLQGAVLNYFRIMGASPDLLLICVIFFGLFLGPAAGLESGFVAGLLIDIFALDFLWINAVIMAITGFTAGMINSQFSKESKRMEFIFVLFFTAFAMSLHFIMVRALSGPVLLKFSEFCIGSILPVAVYTGILSIPIYRKLLDVYNLREIEDYL